MNVICLIGRIGNDLDLRYTGNNKAVLKFNLAVQRGYGENKKTIWIPVTAWEKTAEFVSQYMTKGLNIAVQGELNQNTWEDNEGKKHSQLEVIAKNVFFADSKRENLENNPNITVINEDAEDPSDTELPF